jgi:hypothetical protein
LISQEVKFLEDQANKKKYKSTGGSSTRNKSLKPTVGEKKMRKRKSSLKKRASNTFIDQGSVSKSDVVLHTESLKPPSTGSKNITPPQQQKISLTNYHFGSAPPKSVGRKGQPADILPFETIQDEEEKSSSSFSDLCSSFDSESNEDSQVEFGSREEDGSKKF